MNSQDDVRTKERTAALRKTAIFGAAPEADLPALLTRARQIRLKKGEVLFTAGQASRGMYVVVEGRTCASRLAADGREQVIHEDRAGATFAEVTVFDDGPYPSSVTAVEDTVLLFLPKGDVRRFCARHPDVALSALRLLSMRLRKATGMVEGFALRDVSQRLSEYLLKGARQRAGPGNSGRQLFKLTHTNREIANMIGTVHEVVSRSFARLEKQGWIRKDGRVVEILDERALTRHAHGDH